MAKDPKEMEATMVSNLESNTGKKMAEWINIVKGSGIDGHRDRINFLKSEHGLTYGFANLVVHYAKGSAGAEKPAEKDLVSAQYAGAKAGLKPVYNKLIAAIVEFGDDVEIAPKKSYVSLRRKKQFALLQPSTRTRLDVGINLKGIEPQGLLEASGSFNSMCSHRIRLQTVDDVSADVIDWLRKAWEAAG